MPRPCSIDPSCSGPYGPVQFTGANSSAAEHLTLIRGSMVRSHLGSPTHNGSTQMSAIRVITSKPILFPDLREAWDHRALALMLTRRNIKIRYMQTLLGSIWVIVQPIL